MKNIEKWMIPIIIESLINEQDRTEDPFKKEEITKTLAFMIEFKNGFNDQKFKLPCRHSNIVPHSKGSDMAMCNDCKEIMENWYCISSPDLMCHYYTGSDGNGYYAVLNNDNKHYIKNYTESDSRNENEDACIFCGRPEERK